MTTTQNKGNDLLAKEETQISDQDISKETTDSSILSESSMPVVRAASATSSSTSSYQWSVTTYKSFIQEEYLEDIGWGNGVFRKNQQIVMPKSAKQKKGTNKSEWITAPSGDSSQKIYGGGGRDVLTGCQGDDFLSGGKGPDILNSAIYKGAKSGEVGKGEIDVCNGGADPDIFIVADESYGNYYSDYSYTSYEYEYSLEISYYDNSTGQYVYSDDSGQEYFYDQSIQQYYYYDESIQQYYYYSGYEQVEVQTEDEGCLIIEDFSVNEDKLQLLGSKEQYYTIEEYTQVNSSYYEYGVGVYDVTTDDLVCFIEDSASTPSLRSAGGGKLDLDKIAVFV